MKTFSSFREFLLWRAARDRNRRWRKRGPTHDICAEFAQDCETPEWLRCEWREPPIPGNDAELFAYLERRVGEVELLDQPLLLDHHGNLIPQPSALEFLWNQYLRRRGA